MSELIVTIGVSGSGKSTAINERFPDYTIVSPDSIREQIEPEYATSGEGYNYARVFTTPLKYLSPEFIEQIAQVIPEEFLNPKKVLDAIVFEYAFHLLRQKLSSGENVVFDATTLSPQRWNPLITLAKDCKAKVKALWMSSSDEFEDANDFVAQIIRNNEQRHAIDEATGKPKGRFTPVSVLESMSQQALRLEDEPPSGFDEVIKVPIRRREAKTRSWLEFAKKDLMKEG